MLPKKFSKPDSGFTLVEVIVAIIIVLLFVTTSMQMLVVAAIFKARGKQVSEATQLIQQDLENIKATASRLKSTKLTANALIGDTTITVSSTDGFSTSPADTIRVGSDVNTYTITNINTTTNVLTISPALETTAEAILVGDATSTATTINVGSTNGFEAGDSIRLKPASGSNSAVLTIASVNSTSSPKTLTLTSAIGGSTTFTANTTTVQKVQGVGGIVSATNLCDATISTTGYANYLSSNLPTKPTNSQFTLYRNPTSVTDTPNIRNVAPYDTLQLNYTVTAVSGRAVGKSTIATQYAEVTPDVAIKCP